MDAIYDLITLNKDEIVKIVPNPSFGKGPYICDTQCSLDINYLRNPIHLDDVNCYIDPTKKYIRIHLKDADNHIIYKGADNAGSAGYIKAPNNIVSDKYVLQYIFIFPYVRNHIDNKTHVNDFEIQLVHKSETGIFINIVIHITDKGGDSVQSALYETLFNSIITSHGAEIKAMKKNKVDDTHVEASYHKTLGELCNTKNSTCMTSVIANDFIIDNTVDPQFYSWLDLNVGYKLYWITFDKTIPISPTIFDGLKKYMNNNVDNNNHTPHPKYKTPVIGELIYYKIDNVTYNRRHYLYITLGGTEIPGYAQDKYGKREDKAEDDGSNGRDSTRRDKNDNLIIVNTQQNEKIVIEVDNKVDNKIDNKIKENFVNLRNNINNTINNKINNIRESFSTINIKEVKQGPTQPNDIDMKNIIIYILSGIIIIYIIYRLVLYIRSSQYNIPTFISYITLIPRKIRDAVFSSNSGVKPHQAGGNIIIDKYDTIDSSPDSQIIDSSTTPKTFTGGNGKYKLGLKKIKRKLI